MEKFTLYRDRKVVTWIRDTVVVRANSEVDAVNKLSEPGFWEDDPNVDVLESNEMIEFAEDCEQSFEHPLTVEIYRTGTPEVLLYSNKDDGRS